MRMRDRLSVAWGAAGDGAKGVVDAPATYVVVPLAWETSSGPLWPTSSTSVVQLHMSVATACFVQAVCFSTALFGNGPKSALILSGAGRLRTATNTEDQVLS